MSKEKKKNSYGTLTLLILLGTFYLMFLGNEEKPHQKERRENGTYEKQKANQKLNEIKKFEKIINNYCKIRHIKHILNPTSLEVDRLIYCVNGGGLELKTFRNQFREKEYKILKIFTK